MMASEAEGSWLVADLSVDCSSSKWSGMCVYAVIMLFVYPVGIPLGYYLQLSKYRSRINVDVSLPPPTLEKSKSVSASMSEIITDEYHAAEEKREADDSLAGVRFLFRYYRPSCMYFEIFDALRRIILSAAIGFFGNSPMKACVGMGCAAAFGLIQREVSPYGYQQLNTLHTYTQWQIAFTFFAALVISGQPFHWDTTFLGLVLIGVNLFMFILASKAVSSSLSSVKGIAPDA